MLKIEHLSERDAYTYKEGVDGVLLAGAFGNHINPLNTKFIG